MRIKYETRNIVERKQSDVGTILVEKCKKKKIGFFFFFFVLFILMSPIRELSTIEIEKEK